MQLPAPISSTSESIPGACKVESRPEPPLNATPPFIAQPTHNGRGSVGEEKEPAWFVLGLRIISVPTVPPPIPPNVKPQGCHGIYFRLKGATQPGIPYDSNWRSWVRDALYGPEDSVLPMLGPESHHALETDQYVDIHLQVSR